MNSLAQVLMDVNSYATTLVAVLVDTYSLSELMDWEPETLIAQVQDDFNISIPDINRDKIWALITAIGTNLFYTSPEAFMHICCALTNDEPGIQVFDPPTPEQMAWGITEVLLNDSDSFTPNPDEFSREVRTFMGVILDYFNVEDPPDLLAMAIQPSGNTYQELDDDPVMLTTRMQRDQNTASEIRKMLTTNLKELIEQLNSVPLKNRNNESWQAFYDKAGQFLQALN